MWAEAFVVGGQTDRSELRLELLEDLGHLLVAAFDANPHYVQSSKIREGAKT